MESSTIPFIFEYMKKYYVLLLALSCVFNAFSQTFDIDEGDSKETINNTGIPINFWYTPFGGVLGSLVGQDVSKKVVFLYPDSSVNMLYRENSSKKEDFNGFHTFGDILDFRDDIHQFNPNGAPQIGDLSCSVDSFYLNYYYGRGKDSMEVMGEMVEVVDTLYIQFFNSWHFKTDTASIYNAERQVEVFATPKLLNKNTLFTENELDREMVLLTSKDTSLVNDSGWVASKLKIGLNNFFSTYTKNLGYLLTFKPMLKANHGDTLFNLYHNKDSNLLDGIHNKLNYFGVQVYENIGKEVVYTTIYTSNAYFTDKELLYNDTVDRFVDFKPTHVLENRIYGSSGFYVNSCLGLKELYFGKNALNIFPNPIRQGDFLKYTIENKKYKNVKLSIIGVDGRVLLESKGTNVKGVGILDTCDLISGCYFLLFESNGGSIRKRFVIY